MTVVHALAHLWGSTSKGLDGIQASVLKSLGKDALMQIEDIFRAILRVKEPVPQDWRLSRVVQGGGAGYPAPPL